MNVLELNGVRVLYKISPVLASETEKKVVEDNEVKQGEEKEKEASTSQEAVEKTPEMTDEPAPKETEGVGEAKDTEEKTEEPAESEDSKEGTMPEGEAISEEAMPEMAKPIEGDGAMPIEGMGMDGMMGMEGMEVKPSVMQSPATLIGITAGVLALGILLGIGVAKLKIKKGINLYED